MQKNFCLIVGLASQEETGSETGKIETKFARLDVKHCICTPMKSVSNFVQVKRQFHEIFPLLSSPLKNVSNFVQVKRQFHEIFPLLA